MSGNSEIIFLFGAGVSIPAGLPGIAKLTKDFENVQLSKELSEAYHYVKNILSAKTNEKVDLENILQSLTEFHSGPRETTHLFYQQPEQDLGKHQNQFPKLIKSIKNHLRKELEVPSSVDYLISLKGLLHRSHTVEIFTLNYDSVVETFCEKYDIQCSDGFDLYWNPTSFGKDKSVNLYKLHGSLYWFKTENGKLVKIPVKNLDVGNISYYSDEGISDEGMIYPTSIKELELDPYSYLRNKFIEKLSYADLLVVVGYSFRDKELVNIVKDKMKANHKLWLLIADLEPETIKQKILSDNTEQTDRIVTMSIDSRDAFGKRILNDKVNDIIGLKISEEDFLSNTSQTSSPQWNKLRALFPICETFNHVSKIKCLIEQMLRIQYKETLNPQPELVNDIFKYSLKFGIESCVKQDWINAEIWFQFLAYRLLDTELSQFEKLEFLEVGKKKINDQLGSKYNTWIGSSSPSELEFLINVDFEVLEETEPELKSVLVELIKAIKPFIKFMRIRTNDPTYLNERSEFANWLIKEGLSHCVIKLLKLVSSKLKDDVSLVNRWEHSLKLA